MSGSIQQRLLEQEMKENYVDYSMSVITARALPDVRDGLKPVHRRILYAMQQSGLHYNKQFKKSARVVGDVLGNYHPHGDSAIYDSLVRMAQHFSLRYPLINGHGNFGNVDGDPAAHMRYTECRLHRVSDEMLKDIEKETVVFRPNFDDSTEEPTVLPGMLPNLLVNGSTGIAVGMATNIPPHNLNEICSGIIAYVKNNDITFEELLQHVKAPDFPTGGIICGSSGYRMAYRSGRGKMIVKAKTSIEDNKIIVHEIPYMVNKSNLIEHIANLVKSGVIQDISDIRDESDRDGMRVVITLKKAADPSLVLNLLMKHSSLRTTFGLILLALHDGKPALMNLRDMIKHYVNHRKEVIRKRTEYDLRKAEERAHLLEGLKIALDNVDPVVALIKQAQNVNIAREGLMGQYDLSEKQANAVLEMRLQKLTSLETEKLLNEHKELLVKITDFKDILDSTTRIDDIIVSELEMLQKTYGDERKTEIGEEEQSVEAEDLIKEDTIVVNVTHSGYIKQLPLASYKLQKRGGKGVQGTSLKEEDVVKDIFVTSNRNYLLFFTNKGKVYWLKAYQLPVGSRYSKGKAIVNLLKLEKDERVNAVLPVHNFEDGKSVMMCTSSGLVKKTKLSEFSRPRQGGIRAITLKDDTKLVSVSLAEGNNDFVITTKKGNAVKFNENDVRPMGRTAAGVAGVRLESRDAVVGMGISNDNSSLFTITENGYGKRTQLSEYRLIKRGGKGVRNILTSARNGDVVSTMVVNENDELILMSQKGVVIRVQAKDISQIGRNTQGVRVMKLLSGDRTVGVARVQGE